VPRPIGGAGALPSASPEAYLSGMEKDLQIRLLEELERAWVKCLPGRQAAARNEAHARAAHRASEALKRTLGATRQKAFALGVSLDSRG
jgi:hypothetical protein